MKKLTFILIALCSLIFVGCEDSTNGGGRKIPKARVDIPLTRAEEELNVLNKDFAFRLFQALNNSLEEDKNEQLIVSPLSATFALSMAANGAANDTQREILDALGFNSYTMDEVNGYNQKLVEELTELDNTTLLYIANSMWLHTDFSILSPFKSTLDKYYDAEVKSVDFDSEKALKQINNWCADKTNDCIPDFLDKLDSGKKFIILNALYFNGIWKDPFKKENTQKDTFYAKGDVTQSADFMNQKNFRPYVETESFALADFAYGNEAFSMMVLLPNEGVELQSCIKTLNAEEWESTLAEMKSTRLDIKLPKFELECKDLLNESLQALGMEKAFTPNADFSNLSREATLISEVLQANYICVNEEGTEAASITGVEGGDLDPDPTPIEFIDFHVTRPFLFFIKEKSTGTILFMGKVEKL